MHADVENWTATREAGIVQPLPRMRGAGENLRQRRFVPDHLLPVRRGLRSQLRRSQRKISITEGNRAAETLRWRRLTTDRGYHGVDLGIAPTTNDQRPTTFNLGAPPSRVLRAKVGFHTVSNMSFCRRRTTNDRFPPKHHGPRFLPGLVLQTRESERRSALLCENQRPNSAPCLTASASRFLPRLPCVPVAGSG